MTKVAKIAAPVAVKKAAGAAAQYLCEKLEVENLKPFEFREIVVALLPYVVDDKWSRIKIYLDFALQDSFWTPQITSPNRFIEFIGREGDHCLRNKAKAWYRARQVKAQAKEKSKGWMKILPEVWLDPDPNCLICRGTGIIVGWEANPQPMYKNSDGSPKRKGVVDCTCLRPAK